MLFTSPICICPDCVISRWFPMGALATKDFQIPDTSGLRETWGEELAIGLLPQASVLSASHPEATTLQPPISGKSQTPNMPPNAVQRSAPMIPSSEMFTPRATSSPAEEMVLAGAEPVFERNPSGHRPLPQITVMIPASDSAKRQKKKKLDSQRVAPAPSNRLHISNIPFNFRGVHLLGMFQGCGTPRDAEVIFNERGSKGFGFVTFKTIAEATMIRDLFHGTEVDGRVIEVNYASKKNNRTTNNRLKPIVPDDVLGFMKPASDPETIHVTHRANINQAKTSRKFNGQPLNSELPRAHQNSKTGRNPQGRFNSAPYNTQARFSRPSQKGAEPNREGGLPTRNRRIRTVNNQDMRVIQTVRRDNVFDVQNNANERIEIQQRQQQRDVSAPNQIPATQRKMATGNPPRSGLTVRHTFPNQLPSDLGQQNFTKMSVDKENRPPGVIGDHLRRRNVPPRPEPTWFLNLNFSLSAPLELQGNSK